MDIVFLVLLAASAIRCTLRGFVAEIMSMAAILASLGGALLLANTGALLIDKYVGFTKWNHIIAFLVIFLAIYLAVKLLEGLLHRLFEKIHLDKLDRALGFFLGLAEGALAVVFLVFLIQMQPLFELDELLNGSSIALFVLDFIPTIGVDPSAISKGIDV